MNNEYKFITWPPTNHDQFGFLDSNKFKRQEIIPETLKNQEPSGMIHCVPDCCISWLNVHDFMYNIEVQFIKNVLQFVTKKYDFDNISTYIYVHTYKENYVQNCY